MFRAIWTKTLRDYRFPVFAWGLGMGVMIMLALTAYNAVISTDEVREETAKLAGEFSFFGDPVAITTTVGYTTWKLLAVMVPAMLSIWTVLAGARLLRGEEDRTSMDVLLSTPQTRTSVVLQKLAALGLALVLIAVFMALGAVGGEMSTGIDVNWLGALLMGLNVSLLAGVFAALALFISQFVRSPVAASGTAGGLMVLSFTLDGLGRNIDSPITGALQKVSPFYYYNWNKPLIPTSDFAGNFWGYAILVAVVVVLAGASTYIFVRRDIGGVAWSADDNATQAEVDAASGALRLADRNAVATAKAQRSVFVRSISLQALRAEAPTVAWWLVGIGFFTVLMTAIIPMIEEPIKKMLAESSAIGQLFAGLGTGTNMGFLAGIVFQFVPVLAILFIMTVALSWPSDLDNGRMELVLGVPSPRSRVVLERLGAVVVAAIAMPILIWLSIWVGAQMVNLSLDMGVVATAALGILPMELIVIALVYVMSERLRLGAIVSIVATFIVVSYAIDLLGRVLNLPEWVLSLSMFHVYGTPILSGWQVGSFVGMLAVALALFAVGVAQFARADVQRGA